MIAFDLSLRAQVERYLLAHPCSAQYAQQLRKRADSLTEFSGGWLGINEVTCELVNEWLSDVASRVLKNGKNPSPSTISGYRRAVLTVWNDAYFSGLTEASSLRVRKIRVPAKVVSAYTLDEIRQLIAAAKKLPGKFRNGLPRAVFWEAAIRVGYESGLRRGDCLLLEWEAIASDGRWEVIQHKTGYTHAGKFTIDTMALLSQLPRPGGQALPFPSTIRYFGGGFKKVRKLAGLTRGSFKWLRRSAGSYAETIQPGMGSRMLGHRDARVFQRHYEDRSITQDKPIEPPPL